MSPESIYILSEDLGALLRRWIHSTFGHDFGLDLTPYRDRLHQALRFGDHDLVTIAFSEMQAGMALLAQRETRPVISKDPVYVPSPLMLHVTRSCDIDQVDLKGLCSRFGHPDLEVQLRAHADQLGASTDHPVDVTLLDDVIYSGAGVELVHKLGAEIGLIVRHVIGGIVIVSECGERLDRLGISYEAVQVFPSDKESRRIVDEICERDFFVFAPMTGRSLADKSRNAGFPYMYPFGRAKDWASFGEHTVAVSLKLIQLNIDLLLAMEREIGQSINFDHLTREPLNVRRADLDSDRLVDHLRRHLEELI